MDENVPVGRVGKSREIAGVLGWLSLVCALPNFTLTVGGGKIHFPDALAPLVIWTIFISPVVGAVLAGLASIWNRRWLILLGLWIAYLSFAVWDQSRHPFAL